MLLKLKRAGHKPVVLSLPLVSWHRWLWESDRLVHAKASHGIHIVGSLGLHGANASAVTPGRSGGLSHELLEWQYGQRCLSKLLVAVDLVGEWLHHLGDTLLDINLVELLILSGEMVLADEDIVDIDHLLAVDLEHVLELLESLEAVDEGPLLIALLLLLELGE